MYQNPRYCEDIGDYHVCNNFKNELERAFPNEKKLQDWMANAGFPVSRLQKSSQRQEKQKSSMNRE